MSLFSGMNLRSCKEHQMNVRQEIGEKQILGVPCTDAHTLTMLKMGAGWSLKESSSCSGFMFHLPKGSLRAPALDFSFFTF